MSEVSHFLDNDCKIFRSSFDAFDPQEKRLDNFSNDTQIHKYESLSYVIRLILILSHDHASVERAFTVNNTIPAQNMKPETIIAKRIIKGHVISQNVKPHTIDIK